MNIVRDIFALIALSFAGGVAASRMIPAPVTFVVIDPVFAYFPMAWLAVLACRGRPRARHA
ncbi:MAG TPA: hypothetical protein VLD39_04735 [Gammaproteobacteria bacterium]|nr:hypothetical protein [Gammaproteobacteria bacterium]